MQCQQGVAQKGRGSAIKSLNSYAPRVALFSIRTGALFRLALEKIKQSLSITEKFLYKLKS